MPTALFRRSIDLNIQYWLAETQVIDNDSYPYLRQEQANILRAVQFGLKLRETYPQAVQLITQSFETIDRQGYWQQWIPIMEQAYKKMGDLSPRLLLPFLDCLGQCYRLDRRFSEAVTIFEELEDRSNQLEDAHFTAVSHLRLSQVYWAKRDYKMCQQYSQAALAVFKPSDDADLLFLGSALSISGLSYYGQGQQKKAVQKLREAITIYRKTDQPPQLGRALMNLALSLEAAGEKEEALQLYEEALQVLKDTDYELDKIRVHLSLGTLLLNCGRPAEAEAAFRRADSPYLQRSGLFYYQALTANNLGNTYLAMDRLAEAERYLERSVVLWRKSSGRLMLANTLGTLAEVLLLRGNSNRSRMLYEEAIEICATYQDDAWGRRLHKRFLAALEDIAKLQKEMAFDS